MPPRWLIRAVSLVAVIVMLGLAGEVLWFYGAGYWAGWVLALSAANGVAVLFWTRPSKARERVARVSQIAGVAILLGCTAAFFGSGGDGGGGVLDRTTAYILLGSLWCMLLGGFLVKRFGTQHDDVQ